MKKAILIGVLVVSMVFQPISAFASGIVINPDGSETRINDMVNPEIKNINTVEIDENMVDTNGFSLFASEISPFKTKHYYSTLTDLGKAVYEKIESNIESGTMEFQFSLGPEYYDADAMADNSDLVFKIGSAFHWYDYTDNFWIDKGYSAGKGVGINSSGQNYPAFMYKFTNAPVYDTESKIEADKEAVAKVTADILATIPKNATRKKQLMILNDWLVDNNSYNYYVANNIDAASKLAWIMTSALLYGQEENGKSDTNYNDKNPVCEGYAEAFCYLCEQLNIPCTIVTSATHEWNEVQMEDGKWYHIDVTHNDPVIKFAPGTSQATIDYNVNLHRYSHFLLGSDNENMNDADHMIEENYGLLPPVAATSDYVYANTGDADKDGILEKEDAALILRHISGIKTLTDEEIASADINKDGVLTIADATLLLKTIK